MKMFAVVFICLGVMGCVTNEEENRIKRQQRARDRVSVGLPPFEWQEHKPLNADPGYHKLMDEIAALRTEVKELRKAEKK